MSCGLPNNCSPPFTFGSGGWCGCNCNCLPPCNMVKELTYKFVCGNSLTTSVPDDAPAPFPYPCTQSINPYCIPEVIGQNLGSIDCPLVGSINDPLGPPKCGTVTWICNGPGGWSIYQNNCTNGCVPNSPYTSCIWGGNNPGGANAYYATTDCGCKLSQFFHVDIKISFDGCGLYSVSDPITGRGLQYVAIGAGTLTIESEKVINCGDYTSNLGIKAVADPNNPASPPKTSLLDGDSITFVPYMSGDYKCCPCNFDPGLPKTVIVDFCGGQTYDFCYGGNNLRSRGKIFSRHLKNSIMSRIKKVHHKS